LKFGDGLITKVQELMGNGKTGNWVTFRGLRRSVAGIKVVVQNISEFWN
jgi:hypothetical protein